MSTDDVKQSNVLEYFDRDWDYRHVAETDFRAVDSDDQHWNRIDLPHDDIRDPSLIYWYRKEFPWNDRSDNQQHVYLHLTSNTNESKKVEIPGVMLWLNETEIFNGTLGKRTIELTGYLQPNAKNVLVLCSTQGYALQLHARLLMVCDRVGQVKYDEFNTSTSTRSHRTLDYTASFNESDGLVDVFVDAFKKKARDPTSADDEWAIVTTSELAEAERAFDISRVPRLAIVILVVGTRGDVQPFIALAKSLLACGHRVRLATHEAFRKFVRENDIEFYPLAGDPADLMSFMVKNPGIVPSVSSIAAGDVGKGRRMVEDILQSTWKACVEDDEETGVPFVAEVIIANPPSYGHVHCAQNLQIPLHMVFTMPWSPTSEYPHPFCKVNYDLGSAERINRLSYDIMEMLTWSGLRDLINKFRQDTLDLPPLHTRQALRALIDEKVPYTYCWSPSLIPKPSDWPEYLDVSGYLFLDMASNYTPPDDLVRFLDGGDPPIYIGFGSITGHDSRRFLNVVVEALSTTGYRAVLSGLAEESDQLTEKIFKIGNCPHDWLFQHVAAVCHHGGAGTTAAGLRAGKPTIIVPFFGDQFFWASMISKIGAGPPAIPAKSFNAKDLSEAFRVAHQPTTREAADRLRVAFEQEDGCTAAVDFFHRHLPLNRMRSDLESSFPASYRLEEYNLQISRPVAYALLAAEAIRESQLSVHSTASWKKLMTDDHPHLPIAGFLKHGQKAWNHLVPKTIEGLRQANDSRSVRDGAECIAKGIGKSVGHASIGCLSFYGDTTDSLERLSKLYDPYADYDQRERPEVSSFKSGARAAGNSIWHGLKDGVSGLVKTPRTGYQKDGLQGGIAGAAVAIPNAVIKPIAGTLASLTWLSRGAYAQAKKLRNKDESSTDDRLRLSNHRRSSSGSRTAIAIDDTLPEGRAALASGLTVDLCKDILAQFKAIHEALHPTASPSQRGKSKRTFERQRSQSATFD